MKNAVGREIPEEILKITGKEVFHGVYYYDGYEYRKDGPKTRCVVNSDGSKLVKTIHEALVKCEIRDGMTIGFHHHFRDGDLVVNMVMEEIHKMGIKNITIVPALLGKRMQDWCRTWKMERLREYSLPVCAVRLERRFPREN